MSKRQRKPTYKSLSQPTTSSNNRSINRTFERKEKEENLHEEINRCVIAILIKTKSDNLIRKADLQKAIFTNGNARKFDTVLEEAKKILLKVYGLRIELCEENKGSRVYTVFNHLPYKKLTEKQLISDKDKNIKILDFLILTHVFMSNNKCTESSLFTFLKAVRIDVNNVDPIYNNVKDHINISMVKRKYLEITSDQSSGKPLYSWGPRAELSVSKKEVLNFVATVYNCPPKTWKKQYEAAKQQMEINQRGEESEEETEEEMDTD